MSKRLVRTGFVCSFILLFVAAGAFAWETPTITAASPVDLVAGTTNTNITVATVSDSAESAGSLGVAAISTPAGISVPSTHNQFGTITATIVITCAAAAGENDIVFQVNNSHGVTANATFIVYVSPVPTTPTITATANGTGTTDQACPEEPLTLTASSSGATSYQWYSNNDTISGATSSTYSATGTATYYVVAINSCGSSPQSDGYVVQNPTPHRANLTALGSTSFCSGGSVTLWSDSATGIQWYKDGVAIAGATNESYVATQSGSYTAILDALGCHTSASDAIVVTVTAAPSTPTISATENGTGTTDQACPEVPLTLTASSTGATSYQWYSNNDTISGATSSTYQATGSATYYVAAINGSCSVMSAGYVVQNPTPHAPFITIRNQDSSLTSISFCQGNSVILDSDSATGIQWYKDGVAIASGGNSQSYVATMSGTYTAQLDALGCHSSFGRDITVTVNAVPDTPTISATENGTGTTDQACPEQPLTLTATSNGAESFQWYSDDAPISGATSATYSVTAFGNYSVTATANGCATSRSATYTVQNPTPHAAFLSAVGSTALCSGGSVAIWSDSQTGIVWYKDGVAISGFTGNPYIATQAGSYTVVLDALGCHSQTSNAIIVTVAATPTTPTISATENGTGTTDQACPEEPLTLTATSTGATSFQWWTGGHPIDGATSSTTTVTGSGDYTVYAYNGSCASAVSSTYTVQNPTPHAPFISIRNQDSSLTSISFCQGNSVILDSDSATGIQWYKDGVAISGAGSQSYTVTMSGTYTAQLDALGCHSSFGRDITVTVNPVPDTPTISATENGTGTTDQACPEQPLTLTATSNGATSFQWYADGGPINGATSSTLTVTGVGDYVVVASTDFCNATSSAYTVHNPTPHSAFLSAAGATTFCSGGSVTIWSDSATGIQWYRDGVAIPGAGGQSYTATQSGSYTVILNALGCHSQTSNTIVVTVNATPSTPTISATTNGTGTTDQACPEQPLTLTASSTGATSFQWYADGGPINGATSSTLTVTGVGDYTVTATSGSCTSATSAAYTVHNPTPHAAFLAPASATTFCAGGSVTIWSDSATGIQWYRDGVAIAGAGSQSYVATQSGSYTAVLDALGCHSQTSNTIVVTVNPYPATPAISGPSTTYFCAGGSVTLTSSSASGNQWYFNGSAIGGATDSSYTANAGGDYTVVVTQNGCSTSSSAFHVDGNVTPHTPTITASGATAFCAGGSVTLTADAATGIQWYLNGTAISGANSQSLAVTQSGSYTCTLMALGCTSATSDATVVTVNPNPDATITAPSITVSGTGGYTASVADAGSGATYAWTLTNGTIIGGDGTSAITFTAGSIGTLTLHLTVTTGAGCTATQSTSVTVAEPVVVTAIRPANGSTNGGTPITITGSGFAAGATVSIGGAAATNVVVVSATEITATTGAHSAGSADVVVTNANTVSGTLSGGFTYRGKH